MKRIKTGLTGFILGDWLGMPYRGKGKGTFKPMWTKSYLRGDKCSGNTSMLLCALDSCCNLELYQQNLRDWYFNRKYTGENIEFDIDQVTQKAIVNKRAGGMGLISGRKAFQKPMKDGIELLNTIQDVYLDSSITIA